ncbi:MAG: hypothetical protein ACPGXK_11020, partial [Phycisphaerae bacterium]
MRGKGLNNWRPASGVAVALAFGWALQAAVGGEAVKRDVPGAAVSGSQQSQISGITEIYRPELLQVINVPANNVFEEVGAARQGGVAGMPLECICDADCGDGDPCTADTCDENGMCQQNTVDALGRLCEDGDGDFCTNGQCDDSGNCVGNAAGDNCDVDETCNEATDNCDGTECTSDLDCDPQDDPMACLDFSCDAGNCVADTTCATGTLCDGMGVCEVVDGRCCADLDACTVGPLASCNGGAGPWAALADCDCPKYSSGFNDDDAQDFLFTLIVEEGDEDCAGRFRIGDDYTIANGSYLQAATFGFLGGPAVGGTGDGTLCFEFWDAAVDPPVIAQGPFCLTFDGTCNNLDGTPNELGAGCATDADCAGNPDSDGTCGTTTVARGNRGWVITFAAGFEPIIPPVGYFALRPATGSGETGGFLSTTAAGIIGSNNPAILLENDPAQGGSIGPVLSPENDDVLTFEFVGAKVAAPSGACCLGEGACQDDSTANTVWLCEALGGIFNEGLTCGDSPCDSATCCAPDGSCTIEDPATCTGAGGTVGIFGGSCDPNCCVQPESSTEVCADVAPAANVLDTGSTTSELTLTFSGDTSDAVNGGLCSISGTPCRPFQFDGEDCPPGEFCEADAECTIGGTGPREFHTFEITTASRVEVDWCCTEGDSAPGFRWIVMVDDCAECNTIARDAAAAPDNVCPDGNPTDVYPELAAGVYSFQVFTDRYCQNAPAFTNCTQDSDCAPGEGPCFEQSGPYQIHVNATALPDQACCFGSVCLDTVNRVECLEQNGTPIDGVPLCIPVNPCLLGSCCLGAGQCEDNAGAGISESDCLLLGAQAQYFGGTFCADDPCPVCEIDDDANCQRDTGSFIVQIDRAVWTPPDQVDRWADDIQPTVTGPLDRVCWWPAFFNPDAGTECSTPGEQPADDWQLRVYNDASGFPGAEIGVAQTIIPDAQVSLGDTSRVWQYSAPVTAPPVLNAGTCYWIEITGAGEGPGGCRTYWALSADGNAYSVNDLDNSYGPEDVVTEIPVNPPDPGVDLSLCIPNGLDNCGVFLGACCNPDLTCTNDTTSEACNAGGGAWNVGVTCGPDTCPLPCEAETCETAVDLNAGGEACEGGLPCTRATDTSFCDQSTTPVAGCRDAGASTPIGGISWFSYTLSGSENGVCTLSTCVGTSIDGVVAVYDDCGDILADFLDCGDDTCGIGGGPSEVTWECCTNQTYYFAIGGWEGDVGAVTMELSIAQDGGITCTGGAPEAPLANDIFDVNGTVKACSTDADCQAGETGPDSQTVCRDGSCYVARQRYLSVKPNPANAGSSYALRVSLDTGVAGSAVLGFVQQATNLSAGANNGPSEYDKSTIDASPFYTDWTTLSSGVISIGDCEVSPGNAYIVQSIADGADTGDEGLYSAPLNLPTCANNGDVTGGGSPGDP